MNHAQLTVKRLAKNSAYTIGKLYINNEYFCDTLEDTVRDIAPDGTGKVYARTAIPEGSYSVILAQSPRFKRLLPRLIDVPYFAGVLIHSGNTAEDTHGCILVGTNSVKGAVINSRAAEQRLVNLLKQYDSITITIC